MRVPRELFDFMEVIRKHDLCEDNREIFLHMIDHAKIGIEMEKMSGFQLVKLGQAKWSKIINGFDMKSKDADASVVKG